MLRGGIGPRVGFFARWGPRRASSLDLDGDGDRRCRVEGGGWGDGFDEDVRSFAGIARVGGFYDDFAVDDDGSARESEVEFVGDVGGESAFELGASDDRAAVPFGEPLGSLWGLVLVHGPTAGSGGCPGRGRSR